MKKTAKQKNDVSSCCVIITLIYITRKLLMLTKKYEKEGSRDDLKLKRIFCLFFFIIFFGQKYYKITIFTHSVLYKKKKKIANRQVCLFCALFLRLLLLCGLLVVQSAFLPEQPYLLGPVLFALHHALVELAVFALDHLLAQLVLLSFLAVLLPRDFFAYFARFY